MGPTHGHREVMENDGTQQYDSSRESCEEKIRLRHFYPSRQRLLFVHELLWSYQTMLQRDNSFARVFNVPLVSDVLAAKVARLFSEARPKVLEAYHEDVSWVDVVREGSIEVKRHDSGKYQYFLPKRRVLLEMTEFDHSLILSGIPRQLIHPRSHPSDVQAERNTLDLMAKELSSWNDIIVERKNSQYG